MTRFIFVLLAVLDFVVSQIVGRFLVNWWAPCFARSGEVSDRGVVTKGPVLPKWLAWFDTFDGTLDAGLLPGETSCYKTRRRWLNRNPAYGWSYWVLGVRFTAGEWTVKTFETSADGHITFYASGPHGTFNWYGVRWGILWKFGWKAWNNFDTATGTWKTEPWGPEWRIPIVFSFSIAK